MANRYTIIVLAVLACIVATATAQKALSAEPAYKKHHGSEDKVITLFNIGGGNRTMDETGKALGDTAFISGGLSLTNGGSQVGTLWQTGIYVDMTTPGLLLNYQITIALSETKEFPAGKIFAVGDGSGITDSTQTLPKTIVGGTGPYADARGILNRAPGQPYALTLFNWYH